MRYGRLRQLALTVQWIKASGARNVEQRSSQSVKFAGAVALKKLPPQWLAQLNREIVCATVRPALPDKS